MARLIIRPEAIKQKRDWYAKTNDANKYTKKNWEFKFLSCFWYYLSQNKKIFFIMKYQGPFEIFINWFLFSFLVFIILADFSITFFCKFSKAGSFNILSIFQLFYLVLLLS